MNCQKVAQKYVKISDLRNIFLFTRIFLKFICLDFENQSFVIIFFCDRIIRKVVPLFAPDCFTNILPR